MTTTWATNSPSFLAGFPWRIVRVAGDLQYLTLGLVDAICIARGLAASPACAADAPEGQLTEVLRRRLVEVAGAFDLLEGAWLRIRRGRQLRTAD